MASIYKSITKNNLPDFFKDFVYGEFDEIQRDINISSHVKLSDYDFSGDEIEHAPTFSWELTSYCQYRCTYCYAWEMLTKKFDKSKLDLVPVILNKLKLKKLPKFHVELLGGEPTTHPMIFEILEELHKNDKCISIELITNLAKPLSFFEKFKEYDFNKLIISASYHNEYDKKDRFLEKCIEVNKLDNIRLFFANINFPVESNTWDTSLNIIKQLCENNIWNHFNLIHSTKKYTGFDFGYDYVTGDGFGNNNKNLVQVFNKFLTYCQKSCEEGLDIFNKSIQRKVNFKNKKTGKTLSMPELLVRAHEFDRFESWKCTPQMWTIDLNGIFRNDCTNEPIDILFNDIGKCITCPVKTGCQCDVMLSYAKHRQ